MANIKFEECFLKNAEDFISVEDLQKVYEDHNGSYERHYFGNFYCPECYISQLSFHPNVQTPHFRSNGTHDEGCSFNFKPASKKQIEEYCNDIGNRNEINRKLKSCLDLLSRCNQQSITTNPLPHGKKTQATPNYFTVDIRSKRKSIRRKKLTTPLAEEDYNVPMIFYGTVLLEWDLRNEEVKFLRIRNINKNTYICSISTSNNIYSYIDASVKFDGVKICDMAFLSSMERKGNFNNCRIKYSTELVINIESAEQ